MKLLQCHVDNFGRLSDFDYAFSDGLTVICQPNGFGKSTLAAFLKAMLYGFPRTAGRSISGNERKKYLPWQGGTYGGSLDFEFEGVRYRVRRTFGRTAARDTFSLRDLDHRTESSRFDQRLGEELFQLDADSFMRSVYLPQGQEQEWGATTSIRTKLGDLVDDTDDLNNYDTAMERLRASRTVYRKFRGSGGRIDELQGQIEALEGELADAERRRPLLAAAADEAQRLSEEKERQEQALAQVRQTLTRASAMQAQLALRREYAGLTGELEAAEGALRALDEAYPAGWPEKDAVQRCSRDLIVAQQARESLAALEREEEAARRAMEGREHFADETAAENDIRRCQDACGALAQAEALAAAQMGREELARRDELLRRFAGGAPSREELAEYGRAEGRLLELRGQRGALRLTQAEEERLSALERRFDGRALDEDELAWCEQALGRAELCREGLRACALSKGEQARWESLSHSFASGVPEEEQIRRRQADCRRIGELAAKRSGAAPEPGKLSEAKKTGGAAPAIALTAASAVLIAAGILCFALGRFALGGVLAVAGLAGAVGAVWLHAKRLLGRSALTPEPGGGGMSRAELAELDTLQKGVSEFLLRYYDEPSRPEEKLVELLLDEQAYVQLRSRREEARRREDGLRRELEEAQALIGALSARFYPGEPCREGLLPELREQWREYSSLCRRRDGLSRERERLDGEIGQEEGRLRAALEKYAPADGRSVQEQLRALESDVMELARLQAAWEAAREGRESAQRRAAQQRETIEAILRRYGAYDASQPYEECLAQLRRAFGTYQAAARQAQGLCEKREALAGQIARAQETLVDFARCYGLADEPTDETLSRMLEDVGARELKLEQRRQTEERLARFEAENPAFAGGMPAGEEPLELPPMETLLQREAEIKRSLGELEQALSRARQERDALRRAVDKLPELEDQIARLTEQRTAAEHSCTVLDRTMELLEQARNNLSNSYVGSVESSFSAYVRELLGEEFGRALVDHDLTIRVDEKGQARELDCFSAGTADGLMLCMRLALVDALFTQEKPFLILDDPFVNLDDGHAAQALAMLREISKKRQVIYLVCHSSRS